MHNMELSNCFMFIADRSQAFRAGIVIAKSVIKRQVFAVFCTVVAGKLFSLLSLQRRMFFS